MIASKKNSNILIGGLEPFQVSATKHRNGENEGGRFSGSSIEAGK